jgi:ribosome biogenesis protein UTP30
MLQKPSQIVENIKTALPAIARAIPAGWDNIQSLHIKTNSSVSLPIWSCSLEDTEAGRWHDGEKEGGENTASMAKSPKRSNSKKRSATSDDEAEEEEAPRKKAKPIDQTGKTRDKPTGKHNFPESISQPKSQKRKKSSSATKSEDSVSAKKGKAKVPTTLLTLSSSPAVDASPKKDDKISVPPKSLSTSKATPAAPADVDGKRSKKDTSRKDTPAPPAPVKVTKPTLTKGEAKSKISSALLERKKRLLTKAKGGKSIKNAFLGKKIAQG